MSANVFMPSKADAGKRKTVSGAKIPQRKTIPRDISIEEFLNSNAVADQRRLSVPRLGEYLVCLIMPAKRHEEILGDFRELYAKTWLPRFGPRGANLVYIWQVARSYVAIIGIATIAAVVDRVLRVFGRD